MSWGPYLTQHLWAANFSPALTLLCFLWTECGFAVLSPLTTPHLRCSFRGFDFCSAWHCIRDVCAQKSLTIFSLLPVPVLYQSAVPSQTMVCCNGIHSKYLVHTVALSLVFFTKHTHYNTNKHVYSFNHKLKISSECTEGYAWKYRMSGYVLQLSTFPSLLIFHSKSKESAVWWMM